MKLELSIFLVLGTLIGAFVLGPASAPTFLVRTETRASAALAQAEVFVVMETEDILFKPDFFKVDPGDMVGVRITQQDSLLHTFTLAREVNRVLPTTWTHDELHEYFHDNNVTDVEIPAAPDAIVWANFTAPTAVGKYEYVCLIPGHFPSMVGFMQVGEPPAEGLSAAAIAGIAAVVVAAIVIAVALAMRSRKKGLRRPPTP